MKLRFSTLGAAVALLLACSAGTTTAPTATAARTVQVAQDGGSSQQAPTSDSTLATTQQSLAVRTRKMPALSMGVPSYFIQKQGTRRVKYGKSRWIVLS